MNATIQEIEGIDDYWGPAFRSVYEGEGHEAFVQQLDERIVQHDKEIEKLCNFHYQPKKRKRQRGLPNNPIKSAGVSHVSTESLPSKIVPELRRGNCETSSESHVTVAEKHYNILDEVAACYNDSNTAKKRRVDPKRLGGYSNVFPDAGSVQSHNVSTSALNADNLDPSSSVNDPDDESFIYDGYTDGSAELDAVSSGELSHEESEDISEYHTSAEQQKNQKHIVGNESNNTDLRVYLRNRKQCQNNSAERSQDQNQLTHKPYQNQGHKLSPERRRRRGRRSGTSTESPRSNECNPDRGVPTYGQYDDNRYVSSENIVFDKRRSRRDVLDERCNSESSYSYSQSRYSSPECQYGERSHASANNDRTANNRHCDKNRTYYRERHRFASRQAELSPTRRSRHDSPKCQNGDRRRASLSFQGERMSNEHRSSQSRRDTSERQYPESHYSPAYQEERHIGRRLHDPTERQSGNRRHASTGHQGKRSSPSERRNGDRRYTIGKGLQDERASKERYFGQRSHGSPERYNNEIYHATASLKERESLYNEHHFRQRHRDSTGHQIDDKRHTYASLQVKDHSSHHRHLGQRPHDSAERNHDESLHASASLQRKERTSSERNFRQKHSGNTERKNYKSLHASANQKASRFGPKRHDSVERICGDGYHKTSQDKRTSREHYFCQKRHKSADRQNGDRFPTSASREGTSQELPCGESFSRSAGSSRIVYAERQPSPAPESRNNPQASEGNNLDPSSDLRNCLRAKTAKVNVNVGFDGRDSSTEIHHSESALSDNPCHKQSHLSAELPHDESSSTLTEHHFEVNHHISSEPHYDKKRSTIKQHYDNSHSTSAEFQQSGVNRKTSESSLALSELQRNTIRPDVKSDPIVNSTSSKGCSMKATAVVTTTDDSLEIDENLDDSTRKLCSYLKTNLTCRHVECVAVPRNRGSSSEPQRCPDELQDDNTHKITTESHDTARRQYSIPDSGVKLKTEPNSNTFNEGADASPSLSGIIFNDCHLNQNKESAGQADCQCSLISGNILKSEPNDSLSEPLPSIPEITSAVLSLSDVVLPEPPGQSKVLLKPNPNQIPQISLRPDAKDEFAHNSLNTATSSHAMATYPNDVTQLNHNRDKLMTFSAQQPSSKESQLNPETRQNNPQENEQSTKKRHFKLSVRDVESINLSSIQSKPLLVSETKDTIFAKSLSHVDASTDMGISLDSRGLNPFNNSQASKSNYDSVVVTNRDPRLRVKQKGISSTEPQKENLNNVDCIKIQPNSNVLTAVATNRDPRLRPRLNSDMSPHLTSQIDIIAKASSLPDFDPSNKNQSITTWLRRVNEIAITCKWTDQEVVEFAMSKLAGDAKRWYESFTFNLSWIEWQNKLETTFLLKQNYGKMLLDMLNKTAKIDDSLEDYCIEKITLLNRCSIRGNRAVECITFGIEDEAVRIMVEAEKFNDPDKLLQYLRNITKKHCAVNTEV